MHQNPAYGAWMNAIPEAGDRYGRLTVMRKVGKGDGRGAKYACRCACGNPAKFFAKPSELNSGRVTKCKRCG